jgi:hypothetical protein
VTSRFSALNSNSGGTPDSQVDSREGRLAPASLSYKDSFDDGEVRRGQATLPDLRGWEFE